MRHKRNEPEMTGLDYLAMVAQANSERADPLPFIDQFARMTLDAALGGGVAGMLGSELIACGSLTECEATPVAIVLSTLEGALNNRAEREAQEILRVGMELVAKWARYLAWSGIHPDLQMKGTAEVEST